MPSGEKSLVELEKEGFELLHKISPSIVSSSHIQIQDIKNERNVIMDRHIVPTSVNVWADNDIQMYEKVAELVDSELCKSSALRFESRWSCFQYPLKISFELEDRLHSVELADPSTHVSIEQYGLVIRAVDKYRRQVVDYSKASDVFDEVATKLRLMAGNPNLSNREKFEQKLPAVMKLVEALKATAQLIDEDVDKLEKLFVTVPGRRHSPY